MYKELEKIVEEYGGITPQTRLRVIQALRAYLNKLEDELIERPNKSWPKDCAR